ncbi:MAG: hypothetical protein ACR2M1_17345 [Gemmatimonadaceae bacterium]
MARGKITALGIDLFGVERAVLAVRSDRKGLSVVSGMLDMAAPVDLIGCVAPVDADSIRQILTSKTPGLGNSTVGINEMPGKSEFAVPGISTPDRILGDRRKYAAGIKSLPTRQGRVDAPVVAVVPVPNRREKKWDVYAAAVRPQLAVGVVDAVQSIAPSIRPAIDLRSCAALRAFLASKVSIPSDYAAFVHVDALDVTTVQLSRGDVSFVQRSSGGVLSLARSLAASTGRTVESAWAAITGEGLNVFGDPGRDELLSLVDMEVRSLDARLKTIWEQSGKGGERADPPRVETVYFSGPLADDEIASSLDLGGGISVYPFRPVADLRGASPEVQRHAGHFTVAYGLALNSIAFSGSKPDRDALATDITPLIDLELLPAALRAVTAMPEVQGPATIGGRSNKSSRPGRQLSAEVQRRLTAAMYVGGIGLLAATALPKVQRSRIQKNTVTLKHQAQLMSASVLEDSAKFEQFRASFNKVGSLRALREMAATSHQQLAALARAASLSEGQVWLTQVALDVPGIIMIHGRSESLGSFAAYFRALKTDPAFVSVSYAITNGTVGTSGNPSLAPADTAGTFPFAITLSLRTPSKATRVASPLEAVLQPTTAAPVVQSPDTRSPSPSAATGPVPSPTHGAGK